MRRAWLLALACVLAAALAVLAALQTRWINTVSAAEEQAARRSIEVAAKGFSEEVGREVVRAAMAFHGASPVAADIARRYDQWAASARDRRLIDAIYVADANAVWQFDAATVALRRVSLPPALRAAYGVALSSPPEHSTLATEVPALVMPPLIVQFDRAWMTHAWFPDLTRRTFEKEFDVAVVDDAQVLWRSDPAWPRSLAGGAEFILPILMTRHVRDEAHMLNSRIETGGWRLMVRRRGVSLAEAAAAGRHRSLAISFAILALLGGSFVLLAELARRAERLRIQQLEFVAGITHELNTPLAALSSAGQNLVDGIVSEPAQVTRYGQAIVKESQRLSDLVAQVLEFAGLQSRHRHRSEAVDVARAIDDAIGHCRWIAEQNGVVIERHVDPHLPPIEGDAEALGRAIENLITNGVRHGGGGKWVAVRAARENGDVVVMVEDRGSGIAARDLPHLFEPFYRGRGADRLRGSGLGLTIVKRIAAAHGGSIAVDSRRAPGAAFTLRIPARVATMSAAPAEQHG